MRYLALVVWFTGAAELTGLGACGEPPRPTAPRVAATTPARDLAAARSAAPPTPVDHDRGAGLQARDPRIVDLDIIRITAHTRGPGGDPELTSVASADLFKQANEAARAGRPLEAIAT